MKIQTAAEIPSVTGFSDKQEDYPERIAGFVLLRRTLCFAINANKLPKVWPVQKSVSVEKQKT
ncbi:hypothetical protein DGMP_08350 [Desulfomarina profundi]|uniref:Uncharacterized protein n=1 Tax=Desulfomarina profundi TaxID=2772557 RepID=A0A8D5JL30_9BACT|nr:hypothetical protein DGMP_08350 [Desulfomarina profundi]